ncbi:MAG: sugar phosphate isomerase/epimerase family protein [Solirubrobacterales bacterium]
MRQIRGRREFLQVAAAGAAACCGLGTAGASSQPARAGKPRFELGLASYTLRKFDLTKAIEMTKRVGLKHIALKDFHLAMDSTPEQIRAAASQVRDAGLDLYGGGVIYMKNEAEVNRAFEYAKTAGMKVIIGVPEHALLPLVDKKVKEYDIKVAIHNHGPGDKVYPLPSSVYEKIKDLDPRIGLCNDIGHTARSGLDPAASILEFADRLHDLHIKDVSAANAKGGGVEMGRGVIDIPSVMRALVKINYTGFASFEYEKDENDPLAGLAESVGYARGVMATI